MLDDRTEAVLRRLEREFLGPREGARLRERHIDDALGLATLRPPMPGEQWVDLGSGAGLPGLPLAVAFPASRFTLVDAHRRRVDWVASTTAALHLANVSVVHARLEDYGRSAAREHFDVATARALGQLKRACEILGAEVREVIPNPSSPIDQVGSVVIMAKIAETSPRFPRRSGVPARSPLGGG